MNAKCVMLGSMLLLLVVQTAHAAPVTIQVDYAPPTLSSLTCSVGLPELCNPAIFSTYVSSASSLAFNLDDSQRAVDGSYEVSSSLFGPVWDSYQSSVALPGVTASSLTANAIVQGGLVNDLLLNYGYSISSDGTVMEYTLTGSSGTYGGVLSMSFSQFAGTVEAAYAGTYDITQPPAEPDYTGSVPVSPVPEPETYTMLLAGLGLIGFIARRRRKEFSI